MSNKPIRIENLKKIFKGGLEKKDFLALDNINCDVNEGEVFVFLGPNGAGKTTTIKLLTRLIFPTDGKIWIFDSLNTNRFSMQDVGYLPERPNIYGYLTGREFLMFICKIFSIKKTLRQGRISELIDLVGLSGKADKLIREYSRGMVQRLGLAQALINNPKLLILDEPMAGLDPVGRMEFRNLIIDLKNQGKTIFFSSHILSDAEIIADRVAIINKGRIIKSGILEEMLYEGTSTIEVTFLIENAGLSELNLKESDIIRQKDKVMVKMKDQKDMHIFIKKVIDLKGEIISIIPQRKRLEDVFMSKLGRN